MQSVTLGTAQAQRSTNPNANVTFKNGQVFFGKINKLYPNQTAEVQIGYQKIIAYLDVGLKMGEHYWLQVKSNEGKPVLKVINLPATSTMNDKGAARQILAHLGMTKSAEAQELAGFLIKNQLPITKESLQTALQWLKTADSSPSALTALKTMYVQQLPFVEDVFNALTAQAKGEPFHGMLQQLLAKLTSSTETATVTQLKGILEGLVAPKQAQIQEAGLQKVLSHWLDPTVLGDSKAGAYSLLQKIGILPSEQSEAEWVMKLVNDSQGAGGSTVKTELATKGQQGLQLVFDVQQALQTGDKQLLNERLQSLATWIKGQSGLVTTGIQAQTESDIPKLAMKVLETVWNEVQSGNKATVNQAKSLISEVVTMGTSTAIPAQSPHDALEFAMKVIETVWNDAQRGYKAAMNQAKSVTSGTVSGQTSTGILTQSQSDVLDLAMKAIETVLKEAQSGDKAAVNQAKSIISGTVNTGLTAQSQNSVLDLAMKVVETVGNEAKSGSKTALNQTTGSLGQHQSEALKLAMKVIETVGNEARSGHNVPVNQTKSILDEFIGLLNADERQVSQAKTALTNQVLLFSQNPGESRALPHERAFLQLLSTEFQLPDLTNASTISTHLKDLVKLLGMQFEHALANATSLKPSGLDEQVATLKPLLLQLLQEQQPTAVKELAEQIVSRITAQQMSVQENGPLQNMLLTFPFQLGSHQTDVTLEWSGRKKKDGTIDPNYCRVVFYLDLERLQETVIDMQVQNRVIKLVVHNEQSEAIEAVASSYIHSLRDHLEQMEYKLSGVLFEQLMSKPVVEKQKQLVYKAASSYSGVDIRI